MNITWNKDGGLTIRTYGGEVAPKVCWDESDRVKAEIDLAIQRERERCLYWIRSLTYLDGTDVTKNILDGREVPK